MEQTIIEIIEKIFNLDNIDVSNLNKIEITLFSISVIFTLFLFRVKIIYDFIDEFNNRKLYSLRELLADDNISRKAKIILQDKIDLIAYKKVTGITADKYMQKKIIDCYENAEGRLKYSDFRRAFIFLEINDNGKLEIRKPNFIERIFQWLSVLASLIIFLLLSFFLFAFVYATISISGRIALFLLIISLIFLLFFFLWHVSLIPTANRITIEMEKKIDQKLRPYGLCEGEFTVPDDFDDPLPEDILKAFEGK